MARPQTASDDDILQAAQRVMLRRGHEGFTLSEVAEEVGLSRAAITLRFKSARALKTQLISQNAERFLALLETLPTTPSGDNLIEIAAFIGRVIGHRDNFASFLSIYSGNMKDEALAEIECRRGEALYAAISKCTPATSIAHDAAANAFLAHLSGSIMAWQGARDPEPSIYLVQRTKEWLALAGICFSDVYTGRWLTVPPAPTEAASPSPRARRPRRTP